jgi:hypothetical protein
MLGGGFPPVHFFLAEGAPAISHLKVVEVSTQDDVVRVKIGLVDPSPERSSVVGGTWGIDVDNG